MIVAKAVDGNWEISIRQVKAIGIDNLLDIEVHSINNIANSTSHFLRFRGGGELRFSYNQAGQILEFSWDRLNVAVSPDGEIKFRPHDAG